MFQRTRGALVLAVALVLISCSTPTSDQRSGESSPSTNGLAEGGIVDPQAVLDPLSEELATIREANGGYLPLQESLDLFASALGNMPGGDPARFFVGEDVSHLALRAVMRHWDQLTADQRDAVSALFRHQPPQSPLLASPPDTASDEEYDAAVADVAAARAAIASRLGVDLPFNIEVSLDPNVRLNDEGLRIGAATGATDSTGQAFESGPVGGCVIIFYGPIERAVVYHEVFHCFQAFLGGDLSVYWGMPDWVAEGSAEWASYQFVPNESSRRWFQRWLPNEHSLYAMAYEAIGYFFVLDSLGVSPWGVIDDMLSAGDGIGAVAASGRDPMQVLSLLTTSKPRALTIASLPVSERWDFSASNVPPDGYFTDATVTPGSPNHATFALGAFAAAPVEVLHLEGGSLVRVALFGEVGSLEFFGQEPIDWNGSLEREFCLDEEDCSCGAGADELERGTRDLMVGAGQLNGGSVEYDVQVLDTAFTDGHWQGTISSPGLTIGGDAGTGVRPGIESPIEFTVESGAVTSGSYAFAFPGTFEMPLGTAIGVVTVEGKVTGCGYSPLFATSSIAIDATVETNGLSIPMQVDIDLAAGVLTMQQAVGPPITTPLVRPPTDAPGLTTWLIGSESTAIHRVGELDATAELAVMNAAGFTVNDLRFTFDVSLT